MYVEGLRVNPFYASGVRPEPVILQSVPLVAEPKNVVAVGECPVVGVADWRKRVGGVSLRKRLRYGYVESPETK